MKLESRKVEIRRLMASEGMYITQVSATLHERFYKRVVWLGVNESPDNYREATEAEKSDHEAALHMEVESSATNAQMVVE